MDGDLGDLDQADLRLVATRVSQPAVRDLDMFVAGKLNSKSTTRGDQSTTLVDQRGRRTYAVSPNSADWGTLMGHLEATRVAGVPTGWAERQGTPDAQFCGCMLDFDGQLALEARGLGGAPADPVAPPAIDDWQRQQILLAFAGELGGTLAGPLPDGKAVSADGAPAKAAPADGTLAPSLPAQSYPEDPRIETVMFFIDRPVVSEVRDNAGEATHRKWGFHVLAPGLHLRRGHKKFILRKLGANRALARTLEKVGLINADGALDLNSASVPVLFLGCCKPGGVLYRFSGAYRVSFGGGEYPMVARIDPADLEGRNLVAEAALTGRGPPGALTHRHLYTTSSVITPQVVDNESRSADGAVSESELFAADNALSILALTDPDARQLYELLLLLDETYSSKYDKWRNVVLALGNTGPAYLPLANWFSQRCARKWREWKGKIGERCVHLAEIWETALRERLTPPAPGAPPRLSKRSIHFWARKCNPERYAQVMKRGHFSRLAKFAHEYSGRLEHAMIAEVLHEMLGTKFRVDAEDPADPKSPSLWYEFVVPGQTSLPGEVWKWRREHDPDEIRMYISRQLPRIFAEVREHLDQCQREAGDDVAKAKHFGRVLAAFNASAVRLSNHGFKNGVLREALPIFRVRGFVRTLDKDPRVLGVGNGVLSLGATPKLIAGFHEHAVSAYTSVEYRPFDPMAPTAVETAVLKAIADIIPEQDARLFMMFYLSTGLAGGGKAPVMLHWVGSGANAKTTILTLWMKALGDTYASKLSYALLTGSRPDVDKPNSAKMRLRGRRIGFFEESNRAEVLNGAAVKEIVNPGEITGRDLFGKEEPFPAEATLLAATNYETIIEETDHGMWRRNLFYRSKVTFVDSTPTSPLEKVGDPRWIHEFVLDPAYQSAFLGILTYFFGRLIREYDGNIQAVPCETIKSETASYRARQDVVANFATTRLIMTEGCGGSEPTVQDEIVRQAQEEMELADIVAGKKVGEADVCAAQIELADKAAMAADACERENRADPHEIPDGKTHETSATIEEVALAFIAWRRDAVGWRGRDVGTEEATDLIRNSLLAKHIVHDAERGTTSITGCSVLASGEPPPLKARWFIRNRPVDRATQDRAAAMAAVRETQLENDLGEPWWRSKPLSTEEMRVRAEGANARNERKTLAVDAAAPGAKEPASATEVYWTERSDDTAFQMTVATLDGDLSIGSERYRVAEKIAEKIGSYNDPDAIITAMQLLYTAAAEDAKNTKEAGAALPAIAPALMKIAALTTVEHVPTRCAEPETDALLDGFLAGAATDLLATKTFRPKKPGGHHPRRPFLTR